METAQMLLRKLLDQAGGAQESGFVLVLDGEGLENLPRTLKTARGEVSVHRPSTEIGLRHVLWQAGGAPVIGVISQDLAQRLPMDILRRARHERVHALTPGEILPVVLGVPVRGLEGGSLERLALQYARELGEAISRRTIPTVVDRRLLTELLVEVSVGEEMQRRLPEDLIVAWVRRRPDWSAELRELVAEALPAMHGYDGRVLAWAVKDWSNLDALMVHGAVLSVEAEEVGDRVWGVLGRDADKPPLQMEKPRLRAIVRRLVEGALSRLGEDAAPLLARADTLARKELKAAEVESSRILPLAFANRCDRLAHQAAAGKPIAAADVAWLGQHQAARVERSELEVLEAMARLSRYLDRPAALGADVAGQVQEYQKHGAFADLAALQLRRAMASTGKHLAEARQVLAAYRQRRNEENQRFTVHLASGYEAALHARGVTPLHRVFKDLVAPRWNDDPAARFFLVVLDGCSYPVFLELLYQLSQDPSFAMGAPPDEHGVVCGIPALAPLPTITSHARGALFLGELPHDPLVAETVFRDEKEAVTDGARLKQNKALGSRSRKLLLKNDLSDGGEALLSALRDTALDLVAAVFNAVDDLIRSAATGAQIQLNAKDIVGFIPALREALKSGRRVLLTADHGHSLFVDKDQRAGGAATSRYVVLGPKDSAPEGFVELDLAELGGPRERRAFAWKMGAYCGSPQVGFHGGCGLEEMVVPLAWIVRDGLQANEPEWWFGGRVVERPTRPAEAARPEEPAKVEPEPPAKRAVKQLGLFNLPEQIGRVRLPAAVADHLEDDEKAVLVLLQQNATARATELADALGKNLMRVNGLMARLKRTLSRAGAPRFDAETLPTGETLYRYRGPSEDT